MFVKGYFINIYNFILVIINCVLFFCLYFVSYNKGGVVLIMFFINKVIKEFEIEGLDEKKIIEFFLCLLYINGKCVFLFYCLYIFYYVIKYMCVV